MFAYVITHRHMITWREREGEKIKLPKLRDKIWLWAWLPLLQNVYSHITMGTTRKGHHHQHVINKCACGYSYIHCVRQIFLKTICNKSNTCTVYTYHDLPNQHRKICLNTWLLYVSNYNFCSTPGNKHTDIIIINNLNTPNTLWK